MSQMGMEHEQHHQEPGYHDPNTQWVDSNAFTHSQHQSPVQEYNGFAFTPLPMEPMYSAHQMHPPRTTHQQLQPLIMPQWPSMLTSNSSYVAPVYPTAPVPVTPASATPVSATSTRSHSTSTPRKTLTDSDRRRMCLYHEEHPTVKQTEIGAMFGVERSTVSKVLRQKEKYLYQDDGSRSPVKRSKGKFPDIERALSNWARNHQKQGFPLNDAMIREKARFFATTVGNSDSHLKANSTSWLEKFKQKNNLMGAKSRKNSIAEESEGHSNPPSSSQTPSGISPVSPSGAPSPLTMSASKSQENLKTDSPDSFIDYTNSHRPFHSQSTTSLSSVFTDTAPSSFSAGPTSPTSPFFTPDSACGPSPFMPSQQARGQPGSGNFQRPRSQTFPMLIGVEQYMSPPPSSEPMTPKFLNSTALESPLSEMQSLSGMDDTMQTSQSQIVTSSMQPPPVPAVPPVGQQRQHSSPMSTENNSPVSPSQEDARRALELVMNFFQHQPTGFVEPQDYMTIGKLMEKLKLQRQGEHLPGGLHRIPEQEYAVRKVE
ncbi:CenpB-DNA-bind-domain-containing protein [Mytilinidion resinicola]|uniref:CenpB-DNA-bind-domain-containing protein n=1 Tax=Mytilinidion resinicola TaxID=574789 RepID=A0A6A6Z9A7_9PEZI|nr:CenpB-DNA-bind-domain-containing protein [Mytilinidion resinicola]KAF2816797.1 CenpB-DNA-bind-domain-containing protein [Mytilinidion resinicola]